MIQMLGTQIYHRLEEIRKLATPTGNLLKKYYYT